MEKKRCASCRGLFKPRSQNPAQIYCPEPYCQRERRRRWQQDKRQTDQDYRENQRRAQKKWSQSNTEYWRLYRLKNPPKISSDEKFPYTLQKPSDAGDGVKMDSSTVFNPLPSETYIIKRVAKNGCVKMDAWLVKITLISKY